MRTFNAYIYLYIEGMAVEMLVMVAGEAVVPQGMVLVIGLAMVMGMEMAVVVSVVASGKISGRQWAETYETSTKVRWGLNLPELYFFILRV